MKITAVVVTYNRLALLQECVAAIKQQTRKPDELIVVNNSSTDGTGQWLATDHSLTVLTLPNRGGSWGLYAGIRHAVQQGASWVWIMDDDTIPQPDALEKLTAAIAATKNSSQPFGFFVSQANWLDGRPHYMNIPMPETSYKDPETADWFGARKLSPVRYCSFVSLLVSSAAVAQVGLPVKEMFIWYDDYEYTTRICRGGFYGASVADSVVLHKTPDNYKCDVFVDKPANLWKYRYGIRNELYVRRRFKGNGSFYRNVLKRLTVLPLAILLKRKNARWAFVRVAWLATLDALRFNPAAEKI